MQQQPFHPDSKLSCILIVACGSQEEASSHAAGLRRGSAEMQGLLRGTHAKAGMQPMAKFVRRSRAPDMRSMLACESGHPDRAMRPAESTESTKVTLACDRGSRGSVGRPCCGKQSGSMIQFFPTIKCGHAPDFRFFGWCRHDSPASISRSLPRDDLALGTPRRTGPIAGLSAGGTHGTDGAS